MPAIRLSVGSLRRALNAACRLVEAAGDDDGSSDVKRDPRSERYLDALAKNPNVRDAPEDVMLGRYKEMKPAAHQSPRGSAPEPKNPGYDPQLPRPAGRSPGWLKVYDNLAYLHWARMGKPKGTVHLQGGFTVFRPADPSLRSLFWAALPATKGALASPHAWRTYSELSSEQRRSLGWVDPRDRDVPPPAQAKAKGQQPSEPGPEVRVKGWSKTPQQYLHWSDEGFLEELPPGIAPDEPQVTGQVPGSTPYVSGKGGGMPTHAAVAAAQRAFAAREASLPDWETLSDGDLMSWLRVASEKYRGSRDPGDLRVLNAVRAEIEARGQGKQRKPPKRPMVVKPEAERTRGPKHVEPAEERFGPRKDWGRTSPEVDVQKVVRPPRKKEPEE